LCARQKEGRAMPKAVKTRAQFAAEIRAAHTQTVEAILKLGRSLIAAKKALQHGAFQKMIAHDLPFDATTAQRLMKIARDPRMAKAAHAQLLPRACGTFYELTKLHDAEFEQAVSSGAIHAKLKRSDAARLVKVKVISEPRPTYRQLSIRIASETQRVIAPSHSADHEAHPLMRVVASAAKPEHAVPSGVTPLAISQIERLVDDLEMALRRGDARTDDAFDRRVRAVANRLLALVEPQID
jgi:hypothetical protein